MTAKLRFPRILVVSIGFAFFVQSSMASDRPIQQRSFTDTARVNVVNVDVVVTDKKGGPVFGLTPADFELFEDGRLVPLSNFYPAQGRSASPKQNEGGPSSPDKALNEVSVAAPSAGERLLTLVIFFDNINTSVLDRGLVMDQLSGLLQNELREGTRILLLSYNWEGRLHHEFTTKPAEIQTSLAKLRKGASEGTSVAAEQSHMIDMELKSYLVPTQRGNQTLENWNRMNEIEIDAFRKKLFILETGLLDSLESVVDSLAGVNGHKILLYVSGGIPALVGVELASYLPTVEYDLNPRLNEITQHANAGRVTFYPIDARRFRGGWDGNQPENVMSSGRNVARIDEQNRISSLLMFAEMTGGRKLVNSSSLGKELGDMVGDLAAIYSLGFQPDHFGDGGYHRITVKVNRPNCNLRYREGYLDKPGEQRMIDRTTAALYTGEDDNPLAIKVKPGTAEKKGDTYTMPFVITIPGDKLTMIPSDEGEEGRVVVYSQVSNGEGERSQVTRSTFRIKNPETPTEDQPRQNATFTLTMEVRPGTQKLAVLVRDEVAYLESTALVDFTPQAER